VPVHHRTKLSVVAQLPDLELRDVVIDLLHLLQDLRAERRRLVVLQNPRAIVRAANELAGRRIDDVTSSSSSTADVDV